MEHITGLARASLLQKLGGYVNTQLIYLFAKLGIADLVTTKAMSSDAVAEVLGVPQDRLYRLVRGWISVGLLTENADGFIATPLGALLATDAGDSLRDYALLAGEVWYPAWQGLPQALTENDAPFASVFGCDYYTHLEQTAAGARFNRFMEMRTVQTAQALLETYDFSAASLVVDIGGGNGTLLQGVLNAHAHLQGILFDQPAVVQAALERPDRQTLGARWQVVGGNFFCDPPPVGDLYILSQVLHNWSDDECRQILRNCRQSLPPQGRLLLIEQLIPARLQANQPAVEADLMMLVLLKGRERTAAEYEQLLHAAGFAVTAVQSLKRLGLSLLEAKPQENQENQ